MRIPDDGDRSAAEVEDLRAGVGLCVDCAHGRPIASRRSVFMRCGLAKTDDRFPRYPVLPVTSCPGFVPRSVPR